MAVYALDFEAGSSQYVAIVDGTGTSGLSSISYSFWYKPESLVIGSIIIKDNIGNSRNWNIYAWNDGAVRLYLFDDDNSAYTGRITNTLMSTGNWYHIVYTWTVGENPNVYLNGALDNGGLLFAGTVDAMNNGNINIQIGGGDGYADGVIDDVAIWNRVITTGEITTLYNSGTGARADSISTTGLLNYWDLDEGTGTNANNSGSLGNDGTLTNSPAWVAGLVPGAPTSKNIFGDEGLVG